jgi:predicted AlkP superfamily phosphohydrolase/phosphomutase
MPISTPASFAAELAREIGLFYTQGMPEETNALTDAVFDRHEFLAQAALAREEALRRFRYLRDRFEGGLFFFHFGHIDQVSHMLWRALDPAHPAYDPEVDEPFATVIEDLYGLVDALVAETLDALPPQTLLIVMSDHGFAPWRRAFHLNAWLRDNGYLAVKDGRLRTDPGGFANVDWARTRAYGLGLNGLYVNRRGRERHGVVPAEGVPELVEALSSALMATRDPATGERAVTAVRRRIPSERGAGAPGDGPDLIIGYANGVRCSNESALGAVPPDVFVDNAGAWSGDHCMDPDAVPGVLLTDRHLSRPVRGLTDLTAAILAEFGFEPGIRH